MRIVAGTARGQHLKGPKGDAIRPTSDRTRQTLFDVLGQWCDGLTVLDLFAGTGALGLEAVSRGANKAVLVDQGKEALALCRENASRLRLSPKVEVLGWEAVGAIGRLSARGDRFDLVFADPPYALEVGQKLLSALDESALLSPGARICLEHDKREALVEQVGRLTRFDERKLGDTVVSLYARNDLGLTPPVG